MMKNQKQSQETQTPTLLFIVNLWFYILFLPQLKLRIFSQSESQKLL